MHVLSKYNNNLFGRALIDNVIIFCLIMFPVFGLIFRIWTNSLLILASVLSLYAITCNKCQSDVDLGADIYKLWIKWLALALAFPFIAVLISQFFRNELIISSFDAPSRIMLGIPLLIYIIKNKINPVGYLNYSMPVTIIITFISVLISPNFNWGYSRLTTSYVDPLTFGSMMLTLGILSLLSINLFGKESFYLKAFKILAFLVAIYLSISSGSRTGWLSIPIVISFWIIFSFKKTKGFKIVLDFSLLILFCVSIYNFSTVVSQKVNLGYSEITHYQFDKVTPLNSVGSRISFLLVGYALFKKRPLSGWGDRGFKDQIDSDYLNASSTKEAQVFAWNSGFHNEIMTNMVRSGVWGALSRLLIFIIPTLLFLSRMRRNITEQNKICLLGACFVVCIFIIGLSTEVFNLKFVTSFYTMMLVCFLGSAFINKKIS